MIAPGLDRQGSFAKERRSYSYARLSKIFHGDQGTSEGGRSFMKYPGLSPKRLLWFFHSRIVCLGGFV
jgi:hypothetical protein